PEPDGAADGAAAGGLAQLLLGGPPPAQPGDGPRRGLPVGDDLVQHLGDAEEPDDDGDELHAGGQLVDAEGEAGVTGDGVAADDGEEQPEPPGEAPLEERP